jgi:hypothetical protein
MNLIDCNNIEEIIYFCATNPETYMDDIIDYVNNFDLYENNINSNIILEYLINNYPSDKYDNSVYSNLLNLCKNDISLNLYIEKIGIENFDTIFDLCKKIKLDSILLFNFYLCHYGWSVDGNEIDENSSTILMHLLQKSKYEISMYLIDNYNCKWDTNKNVYKKDCGFYFAKNFAHLVDYWEEFDTEHRYPLYLYNLTMPFYLYLIKKNLNVNIPYNGLIREQKKLLTINDIADIMNELKIKIDGNIS